MPRSINCEVCRITTLTPTKLTPTDRVARLKGETLVAKAEAAALAATFSESSGLSWLWAFLFGPIYFAVHGFWSRAIVVLILNVFVIGFLIAPFLAYPAWRKRAEEKAQQLLLIDSIRRRD